MSYSEAATLLPLVGWGEERPTDHCAGTTDYTDSIQTARGQTDWMLLLSSLPRSTFGLLYLLAYTSTSLFVSTLTEDEIVFLLLPPPLRFFDLCLLFRVAWRNQIWAVSRRRSRRDGPLYIPLNSIDDR